MKSSLFLPVFVGFCVILFYFDGIIKTVFWFCFLKGLGISFFVVVLFRKCQEPVFEKYSVKKNVNSLHYTNWVAHRFVGETAIKIRYA